MPNRLRIKKRRRSAFRPPALHPRRRGALENDSHVASPASVVGSAPSPELSVRTSSAGGTSGSGGSSGRGGSGTGATGGSGGSSGIGGGDGSAGSLCSGGGSAGRGGMAGMAGSARADAGDASVDSSDGRGGSGGTGATGGAGGTVPTGGAGGTGGASGSSGGGGAAGSVGIDASPPCSDGPSCLACCELNSPSGLQRYQETMGDCACSFCSGPYALAPTRGPFNPTLECIQGIHSSPFITECGSPEWVCNVTADCKRYSSCSYGCL
jgi:hypothetical protein